MNDFGGIPLYDVYTFPYIFSIAVAPGISHIAEKKDKEEN